jgi:hypothetical protein
MMLACMSLVWLCCHACARLLHTCMLQAQQPPDVLQPLANASPSDPLFAVENTNANMDSLIQLLKDAGGTVAQGDLKVGTSYMCAQLSWHSLLIAGAPPHATRRVLGAVWLVCCKSAQPWKSDSCRCACTALDTAFAVCSCMYVGTAGLCGHSGAPHLPAAAHGAGGPGPDSGGGGHRRRQQEGRRLHQVCHYTVSLPHMLTITS